VSSASSLFAVYVNGVTTTALAVMRMFLFYSMKYQYLVAMHRYTRVEALWSNWVTRDRAQLLQQKTRIEQQQAEAQRRQLEAIQEREQVNAQLRQDELRKASNTRACPSCGRPIWKDGGCDSMV